MKKLVYIMIVLFVLIAAQVACIDGGGDKVVGSLNSVGSTVNNAAKVVEDAAGYERDCSGGGSGIICVPGN